MGLTTILRGFKVPISILDRFLASNSVEKTYGIPPSLPLVPNPSVPLLGPQETFLRAKLAAAAGDADSTARIFIPQREGQVRSSYGYVAHAYVMVFGQRRIDLAAELPDQAPPGFAELRHEILACAEEGEQALLQAAGMHGGEGEDDASLLYIVLTDEREFPFSRPFMRESDLRCDRCAAVFDNWGDLQYHRSDAHGVKVLNILPDDF